MATTSSSLSPGGPALREIADRVWVLRHPWLDVNVTVVAGHDGLVVVDSLGSDAVGRELAALVRPLAGPRGLRAVVNTHWHFDHTFGNAALTRAWPDAAVVAHGAASAELAREGEGVRAALSRPDHPHAEGHHDEIAATGILVPGQTFSAAHVVDLGDRLVEVLHVGRGHTAGDSVVHVADADVVVAGDLVEESGPPCFGDDSYPLEWPGTLDRLLGFLTPASVVVPGHGALVDTEFVAGQASELVGVAETIRGLAGSGVPVAEALAAGDWPWEREHLVDAVQRGYAQLPSTAFGPSRRLPLV